FALATVLALFAFAQLAIAVPAQSKDKPCKSRGGECTTQNCGIMQFESKECATGTHCCIWVN
ncbi:hypothetical protein BGX29_000345, partial [Mortierella sp. GBA35]